MQAGAKREQDRKVPEQKRKGKTGREENRVRRKKTYKKQ